MAKVLIRTQYLWRGLTNTGIRCPQPDGAFYIFPDFERWREPLGVLGIHTSSQLAVHLLETYQLATLPGSVFGSPPSQLSLRLSSSYLDMETNEQAGAVLTAFRSQIKPEQLMCEHHPNMNKVLSRFQQFVENLSEIQYRMNGRMPEQKNEGETLADMSQRVTSKDHRFE